MGFVLSVLLNISTGVMWKIPSIDMNCSPPGAKVLLGYAVFLHEGEDAIIVDLFGVEEEAVLSALIVHGVALMMTRGVQTVSAMLAETHPWRALLERQGFKIREASPMVIYFPSDEGGSDVMKQEKWLFMHGDRDS